MLLYGPKAVCREHVQSSVLKAACIRDCELPIWRVKGLGKQVDGRDTWDGNTAFRGNKYLSTSPLLKLQVAIPTRDSALLFLREGLRGCVGEPCVM